MIDLETAAGPAAQELMQAFMQFRRLHWQQSPIEGLTRSEMMVLFHLGQDGAPIPAGRKVSEIGTMLHVATSTITQQVQALEAAGLVEKTTDPVDRRAVRVCLTPRGECAVRRAQQAFFASFTGLAAYLGEDDSRRLAALMERVFSYFSEVHAGRATGEV